MHHGKVVLAVGLGALTLTFPTLAQLIDRTVNPNAAGAGIAKSWTQQIGLGRGDANTPNSAIFNIKRDPFRAIRRGRQIFQRKFTHAQGHGPVTGDGIGNIMTDGSIGAGLSDSCASCHGRPRGGAGSGGDVATRPESRDAPHLYGLGLQEMLGDEITQDLRAIRDAAKAQAAATGQTVTKTLKSKGIEYGSITVNPNGTVNTAKVEGVNADLRVRPYFAEGSTISIREFVVGAFRNEMGMESPDYDLLTAHNGGRVVTPSGLVLDGAKDAIDGPPASSETDDPDHDGVKNELPVSVVDYMEFYLLNYFKPGVGEQTVQTRHGLDLMSKVGCTSCHIQTLRIEKDRRVADLETVHDSRQGVFNELFSTAAPLFNTVADSTGFPAVKNPQGKPFVVDNFFADMKRHDLGPNFWERNYDGTIQKMFMTEPLWGAATTAPYGHDGRSVNLKQVILRHGGEAQRSRDAFDHLPDVQQQEILAFLNTLVIFPPDDTASTLDPGDRNSPNFPVNGHGSIKLGVLFNDPNDPE
jgi:cytochrome c peroxidase